MASTSKSTAAGSVPPQYKLSTFEGFVSGALGACVAVTFTNPAEVAKTRLQLDGELRAKGTPKQYTNTLDVLRKTAQSEGLKGCQRGLGAAYAYQIALNGSRLGFFEPIRGRINTLAGYDSPTAVHLWSSILAGASSGVIGAILGNPLFLVKARIQAYSPTVALGSTGARHAYRNAWDGLSSIVRAEGFKGLARGVDAAMLRTAMGSSVQLPAYNYAKGVLGPYLDNGALLYLASSSFSGMCTLIAMQPADTALTRMYNQTSEPGKRLYKNPIDCLWKTAKIEGPMGLYKGSTAHFFRIAPHTILTLVSNEAFSQWWARRKTAAASATA